MDDLMPGLGERDGPTVAVQGAGAEDRRVPVMDAVWSLVLGGGLLGEFLDSGHLSMLDRINCRLRALHADGWRQAWKGWCTRAHSGQVKRMLREASAAGGAKHVAILLQHVVAHDEKGLPHEELGWACLSGSAANGHVEVVKVLLEVGGRDLAMLVADDGASCLVASAYNGHVEVVKVLLEVGARGQALLGPMWAGLTPDSKGDPTGDTGEPARRRQETPHLSARVSLKKVSA